MHVVCLFVYLKYLLKRYSCCYFNKKVQLLYSFVWLGQYYVHILRVGCWSGILCQMLQLQVITFYLMPGLISNNNFSKYVNYLHWTTNQVLKCQVSNIHKMAVKATPLNCWNSTNSLKSKFFAACIKLKIKMDITVFSKFLRRPVKKNVICFASLSKVSSKQHWSISSVSGCQMKNSFFCFWCHQFCVFHLHNLMPQRIFFVIF